MAQIYIMSIIASALALAVWGALFGVIAGHYRRLAWFGLATLPLSFVVNLWVKLPVAAWVGERAGVGTGLSLAAPLWFLAFAHFLAPVTEEAIKLAPLALPAVRRHIDGRLAAIWGGMWLGMGFGVGELWLIAWNVARTPALAGYPWWQYTGFLTERLVTIYAHGVMTSAGAYGLVVSLRAFGLTYLAAVGLHAVVNLGAMLYQLGFISSGLAQASLLLSLLLLTIVFQRLVKAAANEIVSAR